ncbi:hypothetical protein [Microcoleus sp. CAWBG58]|uniref:hypothetical protein n=1 Tax=Microcoleus sp. CAWBG58 TaxID=2841651 RepID=UPI0025F188F5|nr:hypothetical protein [Microcoleus sp. CAWBG58]
MIVSLSDSIYQVVETPKSSIEYFQGLFGYISIQLLIVLVSLAVVIVPLVTNVFARLEAILSNCIKPYTVKVLTQATEFSQGVKLFGGKSAYLIF